MEPEIKNIREGKKVNSRISQSRCYHPEPMLLDIFKGIIGKKEKNE